MLEWLAFWVGWDGWMDGWVCFGGRGRDRGRGNGNEMVIKMEWNGIEWGGIDIEFN
jgi:hypothetical protein